jgi:hypothetical protein
LGRSIETVYETVGMGFDYSRPHSLFGGADFRTPAFSVDSRGTAPGSIDGAEGLSVDSFPQGQFRIELEADGGGTPGFVVDNVVLTSP